MNRRRTEGHRERQKQKTRPTTTGEGKATAAEPASLRAAKALWKRRQYAEALKKFGQAARENRWNIGVLIDAARAYAARYQFEKSDALLARALKLGGKRHDVQFLVGQTYRMAGQFEQAATCFRRACQLAEVAPLAQLELATILERTHRLDEALQLTKRILHAQPQLASALVLKARIDRRRADLDAAAQGLRKVVGFTNLQPALVAEAWGELALVHDQQADYAEAWQSILSCKQILLPIARAEQQAARHVMQRFGQMIRTITQADFQRWHLQARQQEAAGEMEPRRVAMLTGFPRSGTTLLEQILDSHPGIVSAEEQEVMSAEIFANIARDFPADAPVQEVLDQLTTEQIGQQRGFYFEMMEAILRKPLGNRVLLDKNPAMTPMIPVVTRILPENKLLLALRDPRDVVLSCYLRYLPLNPVSVCFLTLADTAGRYAQDMRGWLRLRELILTPWHEVRYEQLINDLPGQSQEVIRFLELPWVDDVLRYRERSEKKHVLSPTYDAVAQPVFDTSVGRWQNYAEYLEPVLQDLAPLIGELGYD